MKLLQNYWINYTWQYSQGCGYPCCLYTFFLPPFFLPLNLHWRCLDIAICDLWVSFLWLTLLDEVVSDFLLDMCQVSSLPQDCVAYLLRMRYQLDAKKTFAVFLNHLDEHGIASEVSRINISQYSDLHLNLCMVHSLFFPFQDKIKK